MCTPKDVLDPSVDGQISSLCGRHDCSLLHFGDPVRGTVYDDRILVSSGQWWPLPRAYPPGYVSVQARPDPGDGLSVAAHEHPATVPSADCPGRGDALSRDCSGADRTAGTSL